MAPDFDPTERRIIGVLIEKSLATPEYYPMTVNALREGCNQKSNRFPVTGYEDFEIEGALRSLTDKKWVAASDAGGRAIKWRHRVAERLGLDSKELAVLAELLLRGPQQPGELRARVSRMSLVPTPEAVQELLDRLARKEPPLVERLARVSGERADRYGQTLAPDAPAAAAAAATAAATATAVGTAPAPSAPRASATATVISGERPMEADPSLVQRVERLEREVAELRALLQGMTRPGVGGGGATPGAGGTA